MGMCVCVCVCACVRACVRGHGRACACVRVCVLGGTGRTVAYSSRSPPSTRAEGHTVLYKTTHRYLR
jgi:hypothetical protein